MYEELVKRLREESEIERWLQPHSANETPKLLDDAADAIERLIAFNAMWQGAAEFAKENKPKWAPVTERLPVEKINPNTHDYEWVLCATIWGDVRAYKYGTTLNPKGLHFLHGGWIVDEYITHWMPLPEPPKEE